jgi:hypothetical protein
MALVAGLFHRVPAPRSLITRCGLLVAAGEAKIVKCQAFKRVTMKYLMRIEDASPNALSILDDTPIASAAEAPCAGDTVHLPFELGGIFEVKWRDFVYDDSFAVCTIHVRVSLHNP